MSGRSTRRCAALLALAALAAGCGAGGGEKQPTTALLTEAQVYGDSAVFRFRSEPSEVRVRYIPRESLAQCGSGKPVPLKGSVFVSVHFTPAATAEVADGKVTPTYTGPNRFAAPGPVLEAAKLCDFEADLGWALGLSRRLPFDVSRDGGTVTVTFG